MPFLSVSDVSKQFGGVTAVDHVTFAVDRGQVVGFLGPNGAGKSTTMRMITQYYEPDTGAITLDGVPLADASRAAKRRIGYLAENNPLYEDLLIINRGKIVADGAVDRLIAQAAGAVEIAVEASGAGVAEALGKLPGVRRVTPAAVPVDGRVAVTLTVDGARDLRPEIFALAQARGWTLYELHRQAGTLEDLFHQLTQGGA